MNFTKLQTLKGALRAAYFFAKLNHRKEEIAVVVCQKRNRAVVFQCTDQVSSCTLKHTRHHRLRQSSCGGKGRRGQDSRQVHHENNLRRHCTISIMRKV